MQPWAGATILLVVGNRVGDTERVRDLLTGAATGSSAVVADAISAGFANTGFIGGAVIAVGAVPLIVLRRNLAPARRRSEPRS